MLSLQNFAIVKKIVQSHTLLYFIAHKVSVMIIDQKGCVAHILHKFHFSFLAYGILLH